MKKKILAMICVLVMMTSLIAISASAARVGDVIGYAQPTDIVATINGYQLESYNVDGYTYICVEDLRYYGFDVYYDNYSRTLSVNRNWGITSIAPQNTNPNFWSIGSNNTKRNILYTDIATYVNGSYVPSCNINGQTIIQFDHLKAFGAVSYDDSRREISLVIEDMYYNEAALFAAYMHDNLKEQDDWKVIVRAKGNLITAIITSREYMYSDAIIDYKTNKIPYDKQLAQEYLDEAKECEVGVNSIYFEYRNTDGKVITSFQLN